MGRGERCQLSQQRSEQQILSYFSSVSGNSNFCCIKESRPLSARVQNQHKLRDWIWETATATEQWQPQCHESHNGQFCDVETWCTHLEEDFKIRIIALKSLKSKGEKMKGQQAPLSTWGDPAPEPPEGGESSLKDENMGRKPVKIQTKQRTI